MNQNVQVNAGLYQAAYIKLSFYKLVLFLLHSQELVFLTNSETAEKTLQPRVCLHFGDFCLGLNVFDII